ncbi:hypothetical protein BX600DRAFT_517835 [Xylariales sp. PMI_506]|nr:hypothetical protein BX600DRAFT_517835 [Xylariales sp. PMI_506]
MSAPRVMERADSTFDVSQAYFLVAFGGLLEVFALFAVAIRIYTRHAIARSVGIDDYLAVGALVTTIATGVVNSINAIDYLPYTTDEADGNMDSKLYFVNEISYNVALMFMKMTFLFQFFRIFRNVQTMRLVYLAAIFVVGGWCISQIFVSIFICRPFAANWDRQVSGAVCLPVSVPTYGNAIGTIVTDVIVLFLPLPTLWSLKLSTSQKWAAFGVFGVGAIVPAVSAGRIWSLSVPPPNGFVNSACFSIAELTLGIIAAAAGTVRALISRHFPTLPRERIGSRDSNRKFFSGATGSSVTTRTQTGGDRGLSQYYRFGEDQNQGTNLSRTNTTKGTLTALRKLTSDGRTAQTGQTAPAVVDDWQSWWGTRARITTGKSNRPMKDGAAEFLGEFGIYVEMNWEVHETIVEAT